MESKNALAELAEEIQSIINALEIDNFSTVGIYNLCKSKRIVAVLAKVEDWTNDYGADEPRPYSSVSAIKECRAIAEEGAGDGK